MVSLCGTLGITRLVHIPASDLEPSHCVRPASPLFGKMGNSLPRVGRLCGVVRIETPHAITSLIDHHARALMVSLSARRLHAERSGQPETVALVDQTLPLVKNWIWTLNDERFRTKRDRPLSTSLQDSDSVQDFAVAVALQPTYAGLSVTARILTQALAVNIPIILGLPALFDPKRPRKPRSGRGEKKPPSGEPQPTDNDDKDQPDQNRRWLMNTRQTRRMTMKTARPFLMSRKNFVLERPPPIIPEHALLGPTAEKAQRATSAGGLFARPHHESLLSCEARAVAKHSTSLASRVPENRYRNICCTHSDYPHPVHRTYTTESCKLLEEE